MEHKIHGNNSLVAICDAFDAGRRAAMVAMGPLWIGSGGPGCYSFARENTFATHRHGFG